MRIQALISKSMIVAFTGLALMVFSGSASAHCDSISGPVAADAKKALDKEQFETVAIWVGQQEHENLRSAYQQTLPVYRMGGKAKALAERHFIETAVRLHRQAEGMPYTGLRPPQPLPVDVSAAEQALETGDLSPVSSLLANGMQEHLAILFERTREAEKNKHKGLSEGRQWADAYVKYVIYVHGLHRTIQAGPAHGVGE